MPFTQKPAKQCLPTNCSNTNIGIPIMHTQTQPIGETGNTKQTLIYPLKSYGHVSESNKVNKGLLPSTNIQSVQK